MRLLCGNGRVAHLPIAFILLVCLSLSGIAGTVSAEEPVLADDVSVYDTVETTQAPESIDLEAVEPQEEETLPSVEPVAPSESEKEEPEPETKSPAESIPNQAEEPQNAADSHLHTVQPKQADEKTAETVNEHQVPTTAEPPKTPEAKPESPKATGTEAEPEKRTTNDDSAGNASQSYEYARVKAGTVVYSDSLKSNPIGEFTNHDSIVYIITDSEAFETLHDDAFIQILFYDGDRQTVVRDVSVTKNSLESIPGTQIEAYLKEYPTASTVQTEGITLPSASFSMYRGGGVSESEGDGNEEAAPDSAGAEQADEEPSNEVYVETDDGSANVAEEQDTDETISAIAETDVMPDISIPDNVEQKPDQTEVPTEKVDLYDDEKIEDWAQEDEQEAWSESVTEDDTTDDSQFFFVEAEPTDGQKANETEVIEEINDPVESSELNATNEIEETGNEGQSSDDADDVAAMLQTEAINLDVQELDLTENTEDAEASLQALSEKTTEESEKASAETPAEGTEASSPDGAKTSDPAAEAEESFNGDNQAELVSNNMSANSDSNSLPVEFIPRIEYESGTTQLHVRITADNYNGQGAELTAPIEANIHPGEQCDLGPIVFTKSGNYGFAIIPEESSGFYPWELNVVVGENQTTGQLYIDTTRTVYSQPQNRTLSNNERAVFRAEIEAATAVPDTVTGQSFEMRVPYEPVQAEIFARSVLRGHVYEQKEYYPVKTVRGAIYTLTALDAAPMPEDTLDGSKKVYAGNLHPEDEGIGQLISFGAIQFDTPGSYEYVIQQQILTSKGLKYTYISEDATSERHVTVKVAENDEKLRAQVVYDDDPNAAVFTNRYLATSVRTLWQIPEDSEHSESLLQIQTNGDDSYAYQVYSSDGVPQASQAEWQDKKLTLPLKNNEYVDFIAMPVGLTFQLDALNTVGTSVYYDPYQRKTLTDNDADRLLSIKVYGSKTDPSESVSLELSATEKVYGYYRGEKKYAYPGENFNFTVTLKPVNGAPMPPEVGEAQTEDLIIKNTGTLLQNEFLFTKKAFNALIFTAADLGGSDSKDFQYTIETSLGERDDVAYLSKGDRAVQTVTVHLSRAPGEDEADGVLLAEAEYSNQPGVQETKTAVFRHQFNAAETIEPTARVYLTGYDANNRYHYPNRELNVKLLLSAKDGAPMPDGSVDGKLSKSVTLQPQGIASTSSIHSDTVQFGKISFNSPGIYHYTMAQLVDARLPYIDYSGDEYDIVVTVTKDDELGRLVVTTNWGDSELPLRFVNRYRATAMAITKYLAGKGASVTQQFQVSLSLFEETEGSSGAGNGWAPLKNYPLSFEFGSYDEDGVYRKKTEGTRNTNSDGVISMSLAYRDRVRFYGLPNGVQYEISEKKYTNYYASYQVRRTKTTEDDKTVTVNKNRIGTVDVDDGTYTVRLTNTYSTVPITGYGDQARRNGIVMACLFVALVSLVMRRKYK